MLPYYHDERIDSIPSNSSRISLVMHIPTRTFGHLWHRASSTKACPELIFWRGAKIIRPRALEGPGADFFLLIERDQHWNPLSIRIDQLAIALGMINVIQAQGRVVIRKRLSIFIPATATVFERKQ